MGPPGTGPLRCTDPSAQQTTAQLQQRGITAWREPFRRADGRAFFAAPRLLPHRVSEMRGGSARCAAATPRSGMGHLARHQLPKRTNPRPQGPGNDLSRSNAGRIGPRRLVEWRGACGGRSAQGSSPGPASSPAPRAVQATGGPRRWGRRQGELVQLASYRARMPAALTPAHRCQPTTPHPPYRARIVRACAPRHLLSRDCQAPACAHGPACLASGVNDEAQQLLCPSQQPQP
jgi:hypothetical protein